MAQPAIAVEGLSKCYHIYDKPRDRLAQALWGGRRRFYREFWALRDVSFEVPQGAAVGIVGRNGSGKSTLLQLVCGTLSPTTGSVQVRGRVAALLELGSGFNPELSGRENVFLNGAILGLSEEEVRSRYDAIVAFAEIGEFLDQPIRTYSSGMVVRLAFAVSVNVDADILVIDEALAVGDARFQLKCAKAMDRMRDQGKTLLFVSHDGGAIKRLCSEAVLLERGKLLLRASPNDTLNIYSKLLADDRGEAAIAADIEALARAPRGVAPAPTPAQDQGDARAARIIAAEREHAEVTGQEFSYGGDEGRIESITVTDEAGAPRATFTSGERARVEMVLAAGSGEVADSIFALVVKDVRGQEIYGTNTYFQRLAVPTIAAGDRFRASFTLAMNVMPGSYFLSLGWTRFEGTDLAVVHRRYDVVKVDILPADVSIGIANCFAKISFEKVA